MRVNFRFRSKALAQILVMTYAFTANLLPRRITPAGQQLPSQVDHLRTQCVTEVCQTSRPQTKTTSWAGGQQPAGTSEAACAALTPVLHEIAAGT